MLKYLFNLRDHPFNRAAKQFGQLRFLEPGNHKYQETIREIKKLCCEAISLNKHDGDAYVMLANVYLLTAFDAFQEFNSHDYIYNMSCCVAVIHEWNINPSWHSKESEQGIKIYSEVVSQLNNQSPDWMNMTMSTDVSKLHKEFIYKALKID